MALKGFDPSTQWYLADKSPVPGFLCEIQLLVLDYSTTIDAVGVGRFDTGSGRDLRYLGIFKNPRRWKGTPSNNLVGTSKGIKYLASPAVVNSDFNSMLKEVLDIEIGFMGDSSIREAVRATPELLSVVENYEAQKRRRLSNDTRELG